jgi:tetratricopeptide (TPR) repeat protein
VAAPLGPSRALANEAGWPDVSRPLPTSPTVAPAGGDADAALLIAIERYAELPPVPGALRNATDWQSYLTSVRRVSPERIQLLRDNEGTIEKIKRHAQRAASLVGKGGTLWVVFIGHGAPAADGSDGLLVGYDAQQDADSVFARSLPQKELVAAFAGGKQARTVVVVDACFSGRARDGKPLVKGLQPLVVVRAGLSASAIGASTLILSAAKSNEFAGPLPGADRPAFSYLVLGGLRGWADEDGNGKVTAREVRDYSKKVLMATVKDRSQEPQLVASRPDEILAPAVERAPDLAALQRGAPPRATGGGAPARGDNRMVTVAVAELRTQGLPPDLSWLGRNFADAIIARLSKGKAVRVVEREYLDQIAAELKLQRSSMVDERSAVTMGRLLGARVFVFGSVSALEDDVVVRARVVSVERGEILDTAETTGSRRSMLALQRDLAQKVASALSVEAAMAADAGLEVSAVTIEGLSDLERLRALAQGLPAFGLDPARSRRRGEWMMALSIADRLVSTFPRLGPAHLYRGLFSLQSDDLPRAREAAEVAVRLLPDDPEAAMLKGNAAYAAHDAQTALATFVEATRRFPDDARGWYGAGRVFLAIGRRGDAAACFLEAAQRAPHIPDAEGALQTLLAGGDGPVVLEELRLTRPDQYDAAVVYTAFWRKDFRGGEPFATRALAKLPNLYLAHYLRGVAAAQRGETAQANAHLQTALALRPTFPYVHRELGSLLLASGQCVLGAHHVRLYLHAANVVEDYAPLEQAIGACAGQ